MDDDKQVIIFLMMLFFKIWSVVWLVGFLLLFLRKDANIVVKDLVSMFTQPNIFALATSVVLAYLFIPITIPYSIVNIFKNGE
jgi:uncharacterized membrane protein